MARNTFVDPAGNRADYEWAIGHDEEAEFGKERGITHSANTGNTGLIRQQNDESPMVFQFSGAILALAQVKEMFHWWKLCDDQTIYFTDYAGDTYEIIITAFKPTRHRTIRNPRDFPNAPYWFWKYDIAMEVISFVDAELDFLTP